MAGVGLQKQLPLVRDCSWIPGVFENIRPGDFRCKSDRTRNYNCIAWAAGKNDNWWWPISLGGYFWPPDLPRELPGQETLENFIRAYETAGFVACENPQPEAGFEKVAIYVDGSNRPTHAARLLPNGNWTSKLGKGEDIEHNTLESIEGRVYGRATTFLKRPVRRQAIPLAESL